MSDAVESALVGLLVRVAIDADAYAAFLAAPDAAARNAGLSPEERAVLASADQNRIYAALVGTPLRRRIE
jgi:hypothetical protein